MKGLLGAEAEVGVLADAEPSDGKTGRIAADTNAVAGGGRVEIGKQSGDAGETRVEAADAAGTRIDVAPAEG